MHLDDSVTDQVTVSNQAEKALKILFGPCVAVAFRKALPNLNLLVGPLVDQAVVNVVILAIIRSLAE